VVEPTEPEAETDLRRRAAWLLGMLAVVAVLFVVVMTTVIGSGGGSKSTNNPGSLDGAITATPAGEQPSTPATKSSRPSSKSTSPSPSASRGHRSCPTAQTCILDGDVGNAVAAINAYRTQHGQPAVPGSVSRAAQTCAVHNGNGCTGGWAETELAKADGPAAVQKILPFGRLLDPNVKNFGVGWAYDPGAKLYYFAIIRTG